MSSSTTAANSSASSYGGTFWERLWRMSGISFLVCFIIANFIYGQQPQVGAPAEAIIAFYVAGRIPILIATVIAGMAILNLMWFTAALRATLADVGQDGWGGAVTTAGAMLGVLSLLLITIGAAISYSIAGSGNPALASGLNDLTWASVVLSSFPRAMLIMSSAFGFWRSGLISNALFAAGILAIVLVLLGGTTWAGNGFWAPDGAYSRIVSPVICLAWIVIVSRRFLLSRAPAEGDGW